MPVGIDLTRFQLAYKTGAICWSKQGFTFVSDHRGIFKPI
jgi:hypothetical protein